MRRFVCLLGVAACVWAMSAPVQAGELFDLYLKAGGRYSDNVTLEPLDDNEKSASDQEDYLAVIFFSGKYKPIDRKDVKVSMSYNHYQTIHQDLGEYDIVGSIGNLEAEYNWGAYKFGLGYLPAYYWVDYDRYLRQHQIKPFLGWRINQRLSTVLSYSYFDNHYVQNADRDGHTDAVSLNATFRLGKKIGYAFGGIGYEQNVADGDDYDYDETKTRLGVNLILPWRLRLMLTGTYSDQRYDDVDSFFNVVREDKKYTAGVSFTRPVFTKWLAAVLDYSYTKNDSNITDYEYQKNMVTLSVTARY